MQNLFERRMDQVLINALRRYGFEARRNEVGVVLKLEIDASGNVNPLA